MIHHIICDKCGHIFNYTQIKLKDEILDAENDVRGQYYRCPKCKKKYVTFVTDPELRKLIAAGEKLAALDYEKTLKEKYKKED